MSTIDIDIQEILDIGKTSSVRIASRLSEKGLPNIKSGFILSPRESIEGKEKMYIWVTFRPESKSYGWEEIYTDFPTEIDEDKFVDTLYSHYESKEYLKINTQQ